jgi:hypothetical protein
VRSRQSLHKNNGEANEQTGLLCNSLTRWAGITHEVDYMQRLNRAFYSFFYYLSTSEWMGGKMLRCIRIHYPVLTKERQPQIKSQNARSSHNAAEMGGHEHRPGVHKGTPNSRITLPTY